MPVWAGGSHAQFSVTYLSLCAHSFSQEEKQHFMCQALCKLLLHLPADVFYPTTPQEWILSASWLEMGN